MFLNKTSCLFDKAHEIQNHKRHKSTIQSDSIGEGNRQGQNGSQGHCQVQLQVNTHRTKNRGQNTDPAQHMRCSIDLY